jgi:hypothetical protein
MKLHVFDENNAVKTVHYEKNKSGLKRVVWLMTERCILKHHSEHTAQQKFFSILWQQ